MRKYITLLLFISLLSCSPKDKFTDNLCNCLELNFDTIEKDRLISYCVEQSVKTNSQLAETGLSENSSEEAIEVFASNAIDKLSTKCDFFIKNILDDIMKAYKPKEALKDTNCKEKYEGEFYYLDSDSKDTILVKIKANQFFETHLNGKYFVKSRIQWISPCEYISFFEESNDSLVLNFVKNNGNTKKFQIVEITDSYIEFQTKYKGYIYQNKLYVK